MKGDSGTYRPGPVAACLEFHRTVLTFLRNVPQPAKLLFGKAKVLVLSDSSPMEFQACVGMELAEALGGT